MRTYASYEATDIRTVKAQGSAVVRTLRDQRGLHLDIIAIKRTSEPGTWQRGFVVLQGYADAFLCYYSFDNGSLRIISEESMDGSEAAQLGCPPKLLDLAEPANRAWRECVALYQQAKRELTSDKIVDGLCLFLKRPYSDRQLPEPISVLKRKANNWVGVDCYGEERYVQLYLDTVLAHCPIVLNGAELKAMDPDLLCSDASSTGEYIYKIQGDYAELLGRPMTPMERVAANPVVLAGTAFDFYSRPFWM